MVVAVSSEGWEGQARGGAGLHTRLVEAAAVAKALGGAGLAATRSESGAKQDRGACMCVE